MKHQNNDCPQSLLKMILFRTPIAACILISLFIVSSVYYYFYAKEHLISNVQQNEFTIISRCQRAGTFTFAPYVSVHFNGVEILTVKVNQGYDTIGDCPKSSFKEVRVFEDERKIQIQMRNGEVKESSIFDDSIFYGIE